MCPELGNDRCKLGTDILTAIDARKVLCHDLEFLNRDIKLK